jgi:hypothetical protein
LEEEEEAEEEEESAKGEDEDEDMDEGSDEEEETIPHASGIETPSGQASVIPQGIETPIDVIQIQTYYLFT